MERRDFGKGSRARNFEELKLETIVTDITMLFFGGVRILTIPFIFFLGGWEVNNLGQYSLVI